MGVYNKVNSRKGHMVNSREVNSMVVNIREVSIREEYMVNSRVNKHR